ncbi:MAG: hypothetical protein IT331_16260 [Anaerolineae bacterium]|nr:hypothetical protein [Anaerolineae bacterium]
MTEKRYEQLIHLLAVGVAVVLWFVSVQFSADGFNFVLPQYVWMGYVLAISVTVIELVFNEEGMNHSLTVVAVGLLSYVYGIVTNIIGIWAAQGSPDIAANPISIVFPALLGLFLEIAPEPLLLWGLVGTGARDFLGHLLNSRKDANKAY